MQNFDFEGIMSPAYNVWDIDTSVVEPTYLELALHSPQSMQFYAGKLRGTTARRRSIPAETLLEMPIPVPSRAEQCKVATALGLARHQIQERQVMTAMLDELVKSRFVEMFGDPAIPSARMSKLVIYARNGVSPSKIGEHREKVLTLSAITQGAFDAAAWKEGTFAEVPADEKRVSPDDFLICRGNGNRGLVGAGEYSAEDLPDLVFPDTVIACRIDQNKILLPYLRYAWKQPVVRKQIEGKARTTNGTFKINQAMVASVELPLPPLALQQEFSSFISRVDALKSKNQQAIDNMQTLYASLSQEYFGE